MSENEKDVETPAEPKASSALAALEKGRQEFITRNPQRHDQVRRFVKPGSDWALLEGLKNFDLRRIHKVVPDADKRAEVLQAMAVFALEVVAVAADADE